MRSARLAEAISSWCAGAALGGVVGSRFGRFGLPLAVVAGVNGVISGWRATYDWKSPQGVTAFVLDSTWGGVTTAAGVVANAVGIVQRSDYSARASARTVTCTPAGSSSARDSRRRSATSSPGAATSAARAGASS